MLSNTVGSTSGASTLQKDNTVGHHLPSKGHEHQQFGSDQHLFARLLRPSQEKG